MSNSRIYLAGFMTSGKSTVGPILANVLGWDYYDLDEEIEREEGKSVVEIFELNGEKHFRSTETKMLKSLAKTENVVVSLGGGTMVNNENLEILKRSGKIVYLKISPEAIYQRVKHKTDRPLFKDFVLSEKSKSEFLVKINEMLSSREQYYKEADITISTDDSNIGRTVDLIKKQLKKFTYG